MTGSWWSALPTVLACAALLLGPGWLLARSWGLRGVSALGAAPALLLAAVGPATVLAQVVGERWDRSVLVTGPAAWCWAGLVLLGLALTRPWRERGLGARGARGERGAKRLRGAEGARAPLALRPGAVLDAAPPSGRARRRLAGGLLLAGLLTAVPVIIGTHGPESPAQASDAVFHLSATGYVRAEGNASPLGGLASMYDGHAVYYPTGWHALTALLPGSVVAGANVMVLLLAALVWPLGVAALLREVTARSLPDDDGAVLAVGTALSGSVIGVLLLLTSTWPYALSLAVLPGALALVVRAVGPGRVGVAARTTALGVGALACLGVLVAHGAAVFNLLVLAGPVALAACTAPLRRAWGRGGAARASMLTAAVAGVLLVVAGAWVMRVPLLSVLRYPRGGANMAETLWAVVSDHPLLATFTPWVPGNLLLAVLAVLGAVAAWRAPGLRRWAVAPGIALALLLLASGPAWPLRGLAGPWYTQRARIMPLLTIGMLVLATFGVAEARRRWGSAAGAAARGAGAAGAGAGAGGDADGAGAPGAGGRASRGRGPATGLRALARHHVPATILLASLVLAPAWRAPLKAEVLQAVHVPDRVSYGAMLGGEEPALIGRAASRLPADAVVVGDPSNGSAYLWSVGGVEVLYPSRPKPPEGDLRWLGEHLDEIGTNPRVCEMLRERGALYYYSDDVVQDGTTGGGRQALWGEPLDRLPQRYLERIDSASSGRGGTATLWRITGC